MTRNLNDFPLYTAGWQEIHTNPCVWFSIHISLFILSCLVAFTKAESELRYPVLFNHIFPIPISFLFLYFKSNTKKGHECIKIIKVKLKWSLWAKAQVEKRDPRLSSIWCSYCWKCGSVAVGRRLSTISWEQRNSCVTALIRKCGKFHSCLYRLANTLWFAAATGCTVFSKHSWKISP